MSTLGKRKKRITKGKDSPPQKRLRQIDNNLPPTTRSMAKVSSPLSYFSLLYSYIIIYIIFNLSRNLPLQHNLPKHPGQIQEHQGEEKIIPQQELILWKHL